MTFDVSSQQTRLQAIEQGLQQAVAQHQAGQLQLAEKLYRVILQLEPNHPEANHNMGVLSVQAKQPISGLPHFLAALEADPTRGQYWLSYIDALFQAGRLDEARQVLGVAQEQGLQGEEMEALAMLLEVGVQQPAQTATSEILQKGTPSELRLSKRDKSATFKGKEPSAQERNKVVVLFNRGRYEEVAALAKTLTERFPRHGFGWNILGTVFKLKGQISDALLSMQKAAELLPGDSSVHCNLGATLQDMCRPAEAEASLRRALKINPGNADAHCNLGTTLQSLGRLLDAEASFRRVLEIKPDFAEAHGNLGTVLHGMGRLVEAEASYRRALEIKPGFADAHGNLGITLHALCRLEEAEACYRRALAIKPDLVSAHCNLGTTLQGIGKFAEAEASYRRALEINPGFTEGLSGLGITLQHQGRMDEALAYFKQLAQLKPGDAVALHQIASLTGQNTERAPDQYVETVFDNYADKFDTHLQQVLKYDAPEKIAALVMQHAPNAEKWDVLDLGCGTGLVGVAIYPFARQLVGVDLSAKMLEKAHERKLYQRLERQDLLTMMQKEQSSSYDLVIAADVFVYLGKLDKIIGEIKKLLTPKGILAFSTESLDALQDTENAQGVGLDYQLNNTGRYAHSAGYLTRLAASNNFQIEEMVPAQLRIEQGKPVHSNIALWRS